jgi:Holliday junction resolvase RusA-like endonuclease
MNLTIYGTPAPQGSKRFVGIGKKSGRGILIESSKKVKPWREDVRGVALELRAGAAPLDGPLVARMVFTLHKPKAAPKSRRSWPDRTPDLSKLVRSTEDALVSAGLIADDARIIEYTRVAKVFPGEDSEALEAPGVRITIECVAEYQLQLMIGRAVTNKNRSEEAALIARMRGAA